MKEDVLHLKAPGNWINDPNGFIYYKGEYHLFFQHFPYGPRWGTMHWGHAVSRDLVHWKHLGIALFPTKAYDRNGVFSGSALEREGKLCLYYSAVRYLEEQEEDVHHARKGMTETSQAMITSEDGYHFDNWTDKRQIIPVIRDEEKGSAPDTRDPKVWQEAGEYFMILGSTLRQQEGRAVFYRSRDGENWEYAAQLRAPEFGNMLECPDLFSVGGQRVFLGSPMGVAQDGLEYSANAMCWLADWDPRDCAMKLLSRGSYVDYGLDLYAPQTNLDREGRRVMIAWMRMPKPAEAPEGEDPWIGMMCLPRVVEVKEGKICFGVHPEVEKCFVPVKEPQPQKDIFRLRTALKEGESLNLGGYRIWREDGAVRTDRSQVFEGIKGYRTRFSTPKIQGQCRLDIFVEPHLIEIFVNEGEYVVSNIVYGRKPFAEGLEGKAAEWYCLENGQINA